MLFQNIYAQSLTNESLNAADTNKIIQIIFASHLRQITVNDSTVLETLSGNASVKQGNTILSGDSIVINKRLGILEVFGNVHINDADTVNTYSQYLKYIGNEQTAFLKKGVKFSDGKAKLFTDNLEYNIKTGIANYTDGGKIINDKTILTSSEAVYYSDTRDVFFKKNVQLKDPKYDMKADSLRYNTYFKNAYFISPTHIKNKNGTIDTRSGSYNLQSGEALFFDHTSFRDSNIYLSGNKIAFDEKNDLIQIEENGKLVDSSNKVIVIGNQILIDKKKNTFLATRKPVMILYQKNDSTYVSADTLYSGKKTIEKNLSIQSDTLLNDKIGNTLNKSFDSIRYFIGFHHVRIYNDSVQAVSDSLHYSTSDSVFKLLGKPLCWNGTTQLSGDTMYLFTQNQQPKEIQVFNNAIVVNKTKEGFFNQMSGKTINGFFNDGKIQQVRTKGSPAESIFYPQDEDSAYIGMNKSKGDVADVFFKENAIHKIKYINEVSGALYPMKKIPTGSDKLKNFSWQEKRRPKNKLEIFE